jgi:hypothetical protein
LALADAGSMGSVLSNVSIIDHSESRPSPHN